ncbi:hypothetical protein ZIOFF_054000 [Zingiber officinale]|uniref:Retroviral polymerase SH3-like domain-containing protein n=1 Tax=Zingiber officinale TaxID=94328 RepID=A0A8J5KDB0_ZINOF|nr:hypothetical protein ZIOFF_054000 [Zingiber officinale]
MTESALAAKTDSQKKDNPSNRKIIVANGSLAIVAGFGNVHHTPNLILKNILYVPLSANLVSVQKLTTKLHCHVIFSPSYCVFQDQDSGRRIGLAKEHSRLYYLESTKKNNLSTKCIVLYYSPFKKGYKCYSHVTKKTYNTMNVTFFEQQSYCSSSDIQEENLNEYHHPLHYSGPDTYIIHPLSNPLVSHPILASPPPAVKRFRVYTRRKAHSTPVQESKQDPTPTFIHSGTILNRKYTSLDNNLDIPIDLRKGVRSCMMYHIFNFISYEGLSPNYRMCVVTFDNIKVPTTIDEALNHHTWRKVVDK